jgi:hypothetical protein
MKPTRLPHPAPRTLAAAPPPSLRSPVGAVQATAFPALAVALAGGVVLPACESPQCGATRAAELERHGRNGTEALTQGRAGEALAEIGVALGVVSHRNTSRGLSAGAVRQVNTVPEPPPPVADTNPRVAGGPMRVLPEVVPPTPPPTTTQPQPPPTTQRPPQQRPPQQRPPQTHRARSQGATPRTIPTPPSSARGGVSLSSALPSDSLKT